MCRPKPGPRCPSCQNRALDSISGRLAKLVAEIEQTKPGPKRAAMEGQARELARQVACRRADLYATKAFQREQTDELDRLVAENPKDPRARQLAAQLLEGRFMDHYRRQQASAMPAAPEGAEARQQHQELGDARFDIAHARLRMDMARGNQSEWQEWQNRHLEAAQRAALAKARMDALAAGGPDGWSSLDKAEQTRLRDAAAADPTLATPVAPRRWTDVVDEAQDAAEGHTPIRDPLDDTGYRPFGDSSPTSLTSDTDSTEPDSEAGGGEPARRQNSRLSGPARERALKAQTARRRSRRRQSKMSWRQIRTGSRRLETAANKVDNDLSRMTPSPRTDGSIFDFTLLSYMTEKVGKQR